MASKSEEQIINKIYDYGLFLTLKNNPKGWTLANGSWSPFYINLRPLASFPDLFACIANAFCKMLKEDGISAAGSKLVGIATAGIPIASAVGLKCKMPMLYTRKLPDEVTRPSDISAYLKHHGQHSLVEGALSENDKLYLFDDVVTSFASKKLAIEQVKYQAKLLGLRNVSVKGIYVVIDRSNTEAREQIRKSGLSLRSITNIDTMLDILSDRLSKEEFTQINNYLAST